MGDQNKVATKRPPHRWKPGESGNPGGRPRDVNNFRELCRKHCPAAIERLAELLNDRNWRARLQAAELLLAYGLGKPAQIVEHSGPEGESIKVTLHLAANNGD